MEAGFGCDPARGCAHLRVGFESEEQLALQGRLAVSLSKEAPQHLIQCGKDPRLPRAPLDLNTQEIVCYPRDIVHQRQVQGVAAGCVLEIKAVYDPLHLARVPWRVAKSIVDFIIKRGVAVNLEPRHVDAVKPPACAVHEHLEELHRTSDLRAVWGQHLQVEKLFAFLKVAL